MRYLLDTNVVSELRKTVVNQHVEAWFELVAAQQLHLSVLVLGEIRRGIEALRRRDRIQAAALDAWVSTLARDYADRILPITSEVAEEWGRLSSPDPLPVVDGLLAATAKTCRLVMVTRNTADFARTGVALLNPFEPGDAGSGASLRGS